MISIRSYLNETQEIELLFKILTIVPLCFTNASFSGDGVYLFDFYQTSKPQVIATLALNLQAFIEREKIGIWLFEMILSTLT